MSKLHCHRNLLARINSVRDLQYAWLILLWDRTGWNFSCRLRSSRVRLTDATFRCGKASSVFGGLGPRGDPEAPRIFAATLVRAFRSLDSDIWLTQILLTAGVHRVIIWSIRRSNSGRYRWRPDEFLKFHWCWPITHCQQWMMFCALEQT